MNADSLFPGEYAENSHELMELYEPIFIRIINTKNMILHLLSIFLRDSRESLVHHLLHIGLVHLPIRMFFQPVGACVTHRSFVETTCPCKVLDHLIIVLNCSSCVPHLVSTPH